MQRIYIETSVVSYYASKISHDIVIAGHQLATRDFWSEILGKKLSPVISALVIQEVSQGDEAKSQNRMNAIQGFPVLDISVEAESLSELLILKGGLPNRCPEDVLHIAIASVEQVEFIATWNFKHINNPFTKNKISKIIDDAGYVCPVLSTPEELLGEIS